MPNPSRLPRRIGVIAALVVAVATALGAWQVRRQPAPADGGPRPEVDVAALQHDEPTAAAPVLLPASGDGDATPGGLSAAQWRTIQARVDPGPQHDRELARIADLLEFQRHVERLRELRADPSAAAAAERRRLAVQVEAGIATHLALRETSGGEAVLLETAVLAELEPDPARRAQRLEAWRNAWLGAHPPESDPRIAEYQRQEAAVVAAWQSGPAAERDPVQLARRLQRLQVAVFDPAATPATPTRQGGR